MPAALSPTAAAPPIALPERTSGNGSGNGNGDGDGGGGGGGGGGDGEPSRDDFPIRKAKLAMVFVLFSLSVLFLVTTFVALLLRKGAAHWDPGIAPRFPTILWANTIVLFASSATFRRAVRAIGRGDRRNLTLGLTVTTVLGVGFLLGQSWAWRDLLQAGIGVSSGNYATVFYWLTGLHAAHVVGGVVFLLVCMARAWRGRYTRDAHMGVELAELYWHFLGAVWLVLVLLLLALL